MQGDGRAATAILLLVLANAFLSLSEFAIISARPTRLRELAAAGYRAAKLASELLDNPGRLIPFLRLGITLNSVIAGVVAGSTWSAASGGVLEPLLPRPYGAVVAILLIASAVAWAMLVAGEQVPKKIAVLHAEAIAVRIAPFVKLLCRLGTPATAAVSAPAAMILRSMGIDDAEKPGVSDEDVMLMIRQGARKGVFESVEYEMISRIFRMSDKRASSIMTPRNEIEWLDLEDSDEKLVSRIRASGRSRFPVAEGNIDNLQGVVRALDLVTMQLARPVGVKEAIRTSMKPALFVPESVPAFRVMEVFRKNRAHLAMVIDEHGSVQGAITLTDVLESIVGDVPADDIDLSRKIVRRSNRTWIIDGTLPVDEFATAFNLDPDTFTGEEEPRYGTMGGFMMSKLGEVPGVADTLDWQGIRFRVIKMDGQRVARLLAELSSEAASKLNATEEKP
jgi:putative hemolysin